MNRHLVAEPPKKVIRVRRRQNRHATLPEGWPVGRVIAMPADTNPKATSSAAGCWRKLDLAGATPAFERAGGPLRRRGPRRHGNSPAGKSVVKSPSTPRSSARAASIRVHVGSDGSAPAAGPGPIGPRDLRGVFTYVAIDQGASRAKCRPPEAGRS